MLIKMYGINYLDLECGCKSPIIWDPDVCCWIPYGTQFIVAIGEAGGFVSAFGEGNTLAMETAMCFYRALKENTLTLDVIIAYLKHVSEETKWIRTQYDFVKTLNKSWFKALFKVPKVIKVANMRNLDVSVWDGLKLLWSLRR